MRYPISNLLTRPLTDAEIAWLGWALDAVLRIIRAAVAVLVILMALWLAASIAVAFVPGGPAWRVIHGM